LKSIFSNPIKATLGALILVFIFILKEHFSGGVITHHLLAQEDMPGLSNWWGLLTIPLLTWAVSTIINNRDSKEGGTDKNGNKVMKRFLATLVFGIVASLLWELGLENVLQYYILLPIFLALFIPVHHPESLLGFVLGMMFSFGGILPIIIGVVILTISFLIRTVVHFVKKYLYFKS